MTINSSPTETVEAVLFAVIVFSQPTEETVSETDTRVPLETFQSEPPIGKGMSLIGVLNVILEPFTADTTPIANSSEVPVALVIAPLESEFALLSLGTSAKKPRSSFS